MLEIAAICLVITALLAYLNHRFVDLPTAIGLMASALIFLLALIDLYAMGIAEGVRHYEESFLHSIEFSNALMQGMLSLLLFAGALHVDLGELKAYRLPVAVLAVPGTLVVARDLACVAAGGPSVAGCRRLIAGARLTPFAVS